MRNIKKIIIDDLFFELTEDFDALVSLKIVSPVQEKEQCQTLSAPCFLSPLLNEAEKELRSYFAGSLQTFSIPLQPQGTAFMRSVWNALQAIPYGETRSYSDIAVSIENPRSVRAVGMANHRNPLPIFIPCHRVIGKNGSLTGYAYGLSLKQQLLSHEQRL